MLTKAYVWAQTKMAADEGATAVEYGLMVAGIALLIIVAVWALGGSLSTMFDGIATTLDGVDTSP